MTTQHEIRDIEKGTVIGLLNSLPDDGLLFVGSGVKPKNRNELISHVRKDDEIGKHVVGVYMNYLRSLKGMSK